MRHEPSNKGKCPVADGAPQLMVENDLAVEMFMDLLQSANRLDGEEKTFMFIRPSDIEACFRLHGIPEEDSSLLFKKIKVLQDVTNRVRASRPRRGRHG